MIEHVYGRAAAARNVDAVIVATDDHRIADAVTRFGGTVRMTSSQHLTGTDRLAEVAAELDCDLIVNVQGDEPLIEPDTIDAAIEPFRDDPALLMSTVCTRYHCTNDANADPNVVKVVSDVRGFALYFSRSPIPYAARTPCRPLINISVFTSTGVNFCCASPRSRRHRSNAANRSSSFACSRTALR